MSPTSYLTAPPRVATNKCSNPPERASSLCGLACSLQNLVVWGIVARVVGQACIDDLVPGPNDHHTAALSRVAYGAALDHAVAATRERALGHHSWPEELLKRGDLGTPRPVA